ncbi:MAG: hypothetical protein AAFQ83_12625 [Bacteroidota bacterium]
MNQYMAEVYLPQVIPQDLVNLIPAQRAQVNKLFEKGHLRTYSLSNDRSRLWVVILAPTQAEAYDILDTMPIMPYCNAELYELMFHDMVPYELPRLSLN